MSHRDRTPRPTPRRRRAGFASATSSPCESLERRVLLAIPGLVAAYGFDEGSGATLTDASGFANHATISGATWTPSGRFGSALSFDGINDRATAVDSASLDLTTAMTLQAWVYPTTAAGVRDVLIKEGSNVDIYNLYASNWAGRPEANVYVGGVNRTAEGTALPVNTWTHLAGVYDGTTLMLYVNGVQAASLGVSGSLAASTGALSIGGNSIWGEHFAGRIDEVRVYNRALTQAEIQADMNSSVASGGVDLLAPRVISVSPRNASTNVATNSNITVTFSEPMDPGSINASTLELRDPGGVLVPAAVSYSATTGVATLNPDGNIQNISNAYYTASVKGGAGGVRDSAGNPLASDVNWSFTTGTPGFQDTAVISGLVEPTTVRFSPDGRVFVAEKSGIIKVFDSLSDTTPTIFADLRTQVHNFWDRGLLGLALPPDFPVDPYVYVLYTFDGDIGGAAPKFGSPGATSDPGPNATSTGALASARLSRLRASGNVMTGSEQVLIHDWFQQFPSHTIGAINFGPDGALYASAGDAASFDFVDYGQVNNPGNDPANQGGALRSQDLRSPGDPTTLDGTIIRIDPATGAALPTNPLYATGNDANARRIIAYGLRNPFRFAFRPGTNELWLADVGWNSWEEINRITDVADANVENFGWPAYEGAGRQSAYDAQNLPLLEALYAEPAAVTSPFYAYAHSQQVVPGSTEPTGGSSTTGVAFLSLGAYPAAYDGALVFADFARDRVYFMFRGVDGNPDPSNRATLAAISPVDLQVGPGGDLFYVNISEGTNPTGEIRRIRYTGQVQTNRPPTAVITANPASGPAPLTVTFSAAGSSDPDAGDTITYAWDLDNDGQFDDSVAVAPSYTFTSGGNKTVRLQVTDNHGASSTTATVISVNNSAPTAFIDTPLPTLQYASGQVVSFSGHATDPDDGALPGTSLVWTLIVHHNTHTHTVQQFANVATGSFVAPDHEYPSFLELSMTATDSGGLTHTTSVQLQPLTVNLTFATIPAGLQIGFGSAAEATPFSRTVIVGSLNTVSAPSPQALAGTTYFFSSWSDGQSANHSIVAPSGNATYTATFVTAAGPVAAYNFDESSGLTVIDATGNGHTGTISGAARTAAGRYGAALSFDGINDWVTIADAPLLDLATQLTLEAWVHPTSNTGVRDVLIKEGANVDVYNLYHRNGFGRPEGNVFVGGANRTAEGTSLALNTWTHLATTYDGATLRLFVNGTLAASATVSGAISTSSGALRIGGNSLWGEFYQGMIDDVRIYARALSAVEIAVDRDTPVSSGPVNHAPVASIVANPPGGAIPLVVNLDGGGSSDPDPGDTLTYAWDLDNDGLFDDSTSPVAQVTYTSSGAKLVRLQVTDNHGATSVASQTIAATNPNNAAPVPAIDSPSIAVLWSVGGAISFAGHATDPEDGTIPAAGLSWRIDLHDSTGARLLQTFTGVAGGSFVAPQATYPAHLQITLTATDSDGGTASTFVEINPRTSVLTFATTPVNLQLSVNGAAVTAPAVITAIVGSDTQVTAPSPQNSAGTNYFFSSWSDGGAAAHTIVVPANGTTYTAAFVASTGLVAAYNFDETSGSTVLDFSGAGNNGTLVGGRTSSGRFGGALNLTANGQMVTVPDAGSLDLTTGMTLEAWIYPTSNSGVRDVVIKEGAGVDVYNLYHRNGFGRPEGNVFVSGANRVAEGTALPINTWTHLATTYDGTTLRLFVNGALVSSTLMSGPIATSSGALRIGGNSLWGEWFRGRIDEVRIYNRALSATEIQTDMSTAVAAARPGSGSGGAARLAPGVFSRQLVVNRVVELLEPALAPHNLT